MFPWAADAAVAGASTAEIVLLRCQTVGAPVVVVDLEL